MNGSDFYGINNILLRYAGVRGYGVFPFSVQHGWQHAATRFEADGNPLEIWVWSERSRNAIAQFYPVEKIRVTGSPYLYLDPIERPAPSCPSLYVLPHSSHLAKVGFSRDSLAQLLRQISSADGGCDVLAYYLDVNADLCAALKAVGSRLLVNGGLWSVDFLHRMRGNLHLYERVYYSGFGSAVLFARHELRQTKYIALESRVESSTNHYVDTVSRTSPYDPVGTGMDTDAELGVNHQIDAMQMRRWILDGFARVSSARVAARAVDGVRVRFKDYRVNVRHSIVLARRHNAEVSGSHV